METLGSVYKRIQDEAQAGQRAFAPDPFDKPGFPYAGKPAETLLKDSFERIAEQVKRDFAQGVAQNITGSSVRKVCSYVPHTEACFSVLSEGNWSRIQPSTVRQSVEETWGELLGWLKEQGLVLGMSKFGEAYGVRSFIVLYACVDTVENRVLAKSERYVAPGVPRFID